MFRDNYPVFWIWFRDATVLFVLRAMRFSFDCASECCETLELWMRDYSASLISRARFTHETNHGTSVNRKGPSQNDTSSSCNRWRSKLMKVSFWMGSSESVNVHTLFFESRHGKKIVHTKWDEDLLLHPKSGNPQVEFLLEVSVWNWKSLFGWGHLFVLFVACRKFCKSMKFGFWSFPEVITIWRIQRCTSFVFKSFIYQEIAPPNIAKFCDLQSWNIF